MKKVLIIDDDQSFRRIIEYNLQEEGYDVLAAASGEQGLNVFNEQNPDLVITDMKMQGISGMDVLASIRKKSPETLVIIVTAFGTVDKAVEAMKLGAYDYITKPLNRDELKLVVRKALQLNELSSENKDLRRRLDDREEFNNIVGTSEAMSEVLSLVAKVADSEATILITGESGTGKELVARAIHERSSRHTSHFIPVNCAAIPPDLLESELFGHVKGAFTGAIRDQQGKIKQADGGTIFLDEIAELPLAMQPKLLRFLQEREIEQVGAGRIQKVDVRVIAATNRDIEAAVAENRFREDLFYRVAVIQIHVPPLRQRPADIPLLVRHFAVKAGNSRVLFSEGALVALTRYPWPGNVRELENAVTRALVLSRNETVGIEDLPEKIVSWNERGHKTAVFSLPPGGYPLERLEREIVIEALERNNWNKSAAAAFLKIPRHVLLYRIEKYAINSPAKESSKRESDLH